MPAPSLDLATPSRNPKELLWRVHDRLANKEGFRHNVYWITDELYRGRWSHNTRDGVGIHTYRNGNRYEGEWRNGKREGQGTFWIVDGGKYRAIYRGCWKDGKWHGKGLLYGESGEKYEGEFQNGKRCGIGKQTYCCEQPESFHIYIGEWLNNKREGIGTLKMVNGDVYEGRFANDLKEGKGVFYYTDKCSKYEGAWKNDVAICGSYSRIQKADSKDLPILEVQNSEFLAENLIEEAINKNTVRFPTSLPLLEDEATAIHGQWV